MALPPAGYCQHCHWLIPLDSRGRLEAHHTYSSSGFPVACMGSRTRPPADPPTEVASLAFADDPPTAICQHCGRDVIVRTEGIIAPHNEPTAYGMTVTCVGSYSVPAPASL